MNALAKPKVITLREFSLIDAASMLRKTATAIETGEYGDEVSTVVLSMFGTNGLNVFSWGVDSSGPYAHVVLAAAQRFIESSVLDYGK